MHSAVLSRITSCSDITHSH